MTNDWCCAIQEGVRLAVLVTPNAKKSGCVGIYGDLLKIKLRAQPIDGKANDEVLRYIANILDVPRGAVVITHGLTNRRKIIEIKISCLTQEEVKQALLYTHKTEV